ncbi:MAG: Ger(x)C family spore germination protein [Bacillus sp. (in: Bacteria)]|nr:Ger(x)C family spore germination protein [Bacillus sp. (in: firmicutes)]
MAKRLHLLLISITLVVCGCSYERIIEELGFIHSIGYELNDGEFEVTIGVPQVSTEAVKDREVHSVVVKNPRNAIQYLERRTERKLVNGQLTNVLYSKEMAEKGLVKPMDTLVRDPFVGLGVKVIIVDGSPKELLTIDYPAHPRTERYITYMIQREIDHYNISDATLHLFMRDYYDDGIDPVAPMIKKGKKEIILDGLALFNGDKYKGRINPSNSKIFLLFLDNFKGGEFSVDLPSEGNSGESENEYPSYFTVTIINNQKKVDVHHGEAGTITVHLQLKLEMSIEEYSGDLNLMEKKNQHYLEEKLSEYITGEANSIINYFQEIGVDPLGIGREVRNSMNYREWTALDWKETYPDVEINIDVTSKLKRVGNLR